MRLLFDVGHPAHVHLFRIAAKLLVKRGHEIFFTARHKSLVPELLDAEGLPYTVVSRAGNSRPELALELITRDWNVFQIARKWKADLMIGTSVSITHVAPLIGARSIVFNEDDADYVQAFAWLAYPFAHSIVVPDCLRDKPNPRYVRHRSYHELAYLHPNHFTPDPAVLPELGVAPGERFFVLRMVALKAHHDVGHTGLSLESKRKLISKLSSHGKLFITVEGNLEPEFRQYELKIPPHRIHHALHYATMLLSDSQTMTVEAAVLGTPSIRCNSFVGLCSIIEELEHKYELTFGYHPLKEQAMLAKLDELLADPNLKETFRARQQRMLADKIDLTEWMVKFLEEYPGSARHGSAH